MNWPDSLGPMPEAVRELQSYRESNHVRLWEEPYLAAIEALKNRLVKSIEWGRIEQKRKQEAEEREHNAIVRAEQAEAAIAALDSWDGMMGQATKHYPQDVAYFAQSNDPGCRIVRGLHAIDAERKRAEQAEAERDELRVRMDDDCTDCAVGVDKHKRQLAVEEVARLLDANLKQAKALTSAERALIAQRDEVARLNDGLHLIIESIPGQAHRIAMQILGSEGRQP